MPAAVVSIISDYTHTFSDSEFDVLNDRGNYITVIDDDVIKYDIFGMRKFEENSDARSHVLIARHTHAVVFWIADSNPGRDRNHVDPNNYVDTNGCAQIACSKNTYEFIHDNFGHPARLAIWNMLWPREPISPGFILMCDTLIRITSDWLYSKPRTMACPWI